MGAKAARLTAFVRANKGNVASILLAIAGWALSFYLYFAAKQYREPVFLVDPVRTSLADTTTGESVPFTVLDSAGNPLSGAITSVQFYLFNRGNQPIRSSDVLVPIRIRVADPSSRILDARVVKLTRDLIHIDGAPILSITSDDVSSVDVAFRILESGDGIVGQIIFNGGPSSQLTIAGVVEGAPKFTTSSDLLGPYVLRSIARVVMIVLAWVLVGGLTVLIGLVSADIISRESGKAGLALRSAAHVGRVAPAILLVALLSWFVFQIGASIYNAPSRGPMPELVRYALPPALVP